MSPAVTGAPSRAKVPLPDTGSVTIVTLASAAPVSTSVKSKSSAAKAYSVSSGVVTTSSAEVGASFTAVTLTVMV